MEKLNCSGVRSVDSASTHTHTPHPYDVILSDIISAYGHGLEFMLNHNTTFSIGKYDCDDKKPTTGDPGLLQIMTQVSSLIINVSCSVKYRAYICICLIVECSCLFSSFIRTNDYPLNKNHIKSHMVSPLTRLFSCILNTCILVFNICFV